MTGSHDQIVVVGANRILIVESGHMAAGSMPGWEALSSMTRRGVMGMTSRKLAAFGAAVMVALATITVTGSPAQAAPVRHFKNCTAMHKVYPHGVGKPKAHDHVRGTTRPVTTFKRSLALYNANKKMDRDHDGVACEKR
jgi:hypothetical protein